MIENLPQKYLNGVWLLRGLLNEELGFKEAAIIDFANAKKFDDSSSAYLEKQETISLTVFPLMNRLCTMFPYIDLEFPKRPKLVFQYSMIVQRVKPSFSFPFVKPPNMIPAADDELLSEFEPLAFSCRPEAPWIRKWENGIKFTDEIQDDNKIQIAPVGNSFLSHAIDEEKCIFIPKDKYAKYKQRKFRVKMKANSETNVTNSAHTENAQSKLD